jgi:CheY-specific phosphatase CheX
MENIRDILKGSIFEVFERMFFIFLEPGGHVPGHHYESSIGFDGPRRGSIRIRLSRPVARLMVRNMLGISDEKEIERSLEDCVKEAANMLCGNFLVNLDASEKFTVALPAFSVRPGPPPAESEGVHAVDFDCEAGKLEVILEMQGKG